MAPNVTYPTDADALAEALNDPTVVAEHFADPEKAKDFVTGTVDAMRDKDQGSIDEQVAIEAQKQAAEMLEAAGYRPDGPPVGGSDAEAVLKAAARAASPTYSAKAAGAKLDQHFDDSAQFFHTIHHQAQNRGDWGELEPKLDELRTVTNAYSSTLGSEGGFLVPEQFRSELLRLSLETSVVRGRARTIPMSGPRVAIPAIDDTTHVGSVFGGMVAYWTEEAAAMTETEASFQQLTLESKTLTIYSEIPNQLIADAVAFGAFFDQTAPEAAAWFEDLAFMTGTGVGEPLGVLNADAMISVAKEGGQAADTIQWENIVNAYARLLPQSLNRAVWVVSPDTFPQLATMTFSGVPVMIREGGGDQSPYSSILGRPVVVSEKANVLGDAGDINLIDFGFYLIGDQQAMTATSSEHYKFKNNMTAFRIVERIDGRPWLGSAITPQNGGPTLSPFVNVAARA